MADVGWLNMSVTDFDLADWVCCEAEFYIFPNEKVWPIWIWPNLSVTNIDLADMV